MVSGWAGNYRAAKKSGLQCFNNKRQCTGCSGSTYYGIEEKTVYECGEELNIDDLTVQYYGTDGKVTIVENSNYTTNKDSIDMNTLGSKELCVTYNDNGKELKATVNLTVRKAAEIIAEGSSNSINWKIDGKGKLIVTGTGDYEKTDYIYAPWYVYRVRIKEAEINVTGMTDASNLFADCIYLKKIDLSGFDTKNVTNMRGMFSYCTSLEKLDLSNFDLSGLSDDIGIQPFEYCTSLSSIYTPKNCPANIELPAEDGDKWYKEDGTECTTLPTGLASSILLYKNNPPEEGDKEVTVKFDLQGHGAQISPVTVNSGDLLTAPEDPTEEGYAFGGWYKEAGCTNAWNFDSDTVTADATLYAKWTSNEPEVKCTVTFDMQGHGTQIIQRQMAR